ncbi:MAG: porin [bacterium]
MINKKMVTMMLVMLVAFAAMTANAGDAPYTVYGHLHVSLDALNNGDSTEMVLASNTSRFGIKGAQELNDNFTFIWQFESFLNLTVKDTKGLLANRNSYLGLKGDWGWMKAGIHDTPMKLIGRKVEFFKDELGDFRQVTFGWDRRMDKIIMYGTPDYNGFALIGAYQFKNDVTMADTGAMSANATYTNDSFFFGAAYELIQKNNFATAEVPGYWMPQDQYQNVWVPAVPADFDVEDAIGMRFVGKYTAGDLEIAALYQMLQNPEGKMYSYMENSTMVSGDLNSQTWGIGARYTMNEKFAVKGQFYGFDPNTDMDDDDASFFAMGFDHTYNKSTTFYTQFVLTNNGETTSFPVGGEGHGTRMFPYPADAGEATNDPWGISTGMIKKF